MSGWVRFKDFHCDNDCQMSGCPGHQMALEFFGVSDTYEIRIDGDHVRYFDENTLATITDLFQKGCSA